MDEPVLERPFTIALLALGGQGGGVLTQWLVDVAESCDYLVQSTYVAGVAQRTGATVYCVDLFPKTQADKVGKSPVFNLYPVPGCVDLVIASELAEAGRAIQKGFVTPNVTTLISSSHRVYGVNEKTAMGDGKMNTGPILDAAKNLSQQFHCFDMAEAAEAAGCAISAVILGAVAGSMVLPFPRRAFEEAIRRGGRSVDSNLRGFEVGFQGVQAPIQPVQAPPALELPAPDGPNGHALKQKITETFPQELQALLLHGALKALDYQDRAYGEDYIERVQTMMVADQNKNPGGDLKLTRTYARILALQMCYEDTIRVADLKSRLSRRIQIRKDIQAKPGQPAYVQEYFHPRFEELCDTLPATLGQRLLHSSFARKLAAPFLKSGKRIHTNKVFGFLLLHGLSQLKSRRRGTLRYQTQQTHIENWENAIKTALQLDYDYAVATAEIMEMVSGYGDTHQRGLQRYETSLDAASKAEADNAKILRRLQEAAMADEAGSAFASEVQGLGGR